MLEIMYDVPGDASVREVLLDEDTILTGRRPLIGLSEEAA
jgi:ATP-dependent protease Clp ATPase subunit